MHTEYAEKSKNIVLTDTKYLNKKLAKIKKFVSFCALPCKILNSFEFAPEGMGARREGARGSTCPPPLEFEKNDVMCCRPAKYPQFVAFGACLRYSIFQPKTAQKPKNFRLRRRRAEEMVMFLYGAPKTCQLF